MPDLSNQKADEIKSTIGKIEEENEKKRGLDTGDKNNPNGDNEYSLETEWARGNSFTLYDQKSRFSEPYWNNFNTSVTNIFGGGEIDGQTIKLSEIEAFEDFSSMYGDALSAAGLNLQDPIKANAFYYNKSGREMLNEPPQVGKTYIFFTRPDLNLCQANIDSHPTFKWLFAQPRGREIMSMLTGPDRVLYGNISGLTLDELDARDNHLIAQNPLDAIKKTKEVLVDKPISGLAKLAYERLSNQISVMEDIYQSHILPLYKQAKDTAGAAVDKLKEIGNNIVDLITKNTRYNKIGDKTHEEIEYQFTADIGEVEEGEEPLIRNVDPEFKAATATQEDFMPLVAKRVPKFFDPYTRTYGNTRTNPRTGEKTEMLFTSPFIPLLNNNCESWPAGKDLVLESYEYPEDFRGHRLNVPTGGNAINNSGETTVQFRDNREDYVKWLFYIWTEYIWAVNEGTMYPRWTNIVERTLDYTSSVYIFTLDKDGQTIRSWAKYTGGSPRSFSNAHIFHQSKDLDAEAFRSVSVNWGYNIYEPLNPEVFTDFNLLSETEWRRKPKNILGEKYFAIENTVNVLEMDFTKEEEKLKKEGKSLIWDYLKASDIHSGVSGQVPVKALPERMDTSYFGHYTNWLKRHPHDYEYTNHYGGYPYVINGGRQLVWINPYDALNSKDTRELQIF